jgi:hypothetical protein
MSCTFALLFCCAALSPRRRRRRACVPARCHACVPLLVLFTPAAARNMRKKQMVP